MHEHEFDTVDARRRSGPSQRTKEPPFAALVTVSWGTYALLAEELAEGATFTLGEGGALPLPAGVLGGESLALLRVSRGGAVRLRVHPALRGDVSIGGKAVDLGTFVSSVRPGASERSDEVAEVVLPDGCEVHLSLGASLFAVHVTVGARTAGSPIGVARNLSPWALAMAALSFTLHGALVGVFVFYREAMVADDSGTVDRDQILFMRAMLANAAERELERPNADDETVHDGEKAGGSSVSARGPAGASGSSTSKSPRGRLAIEGPADTPEPHVARERLLAQAANFGMLGLLQTPPDGAALASPFARPVLVAGRDSTSASGSLFDADPGDRFGSDGFGPAGSARGGGGEGDFVGLDHIGTVLRGSGAGPNAGIGPRTTGGEGGAHRPRGPSLRAANVESNGRLPAEVIQRTLRRQSGRFRFCYETGLARNPNLAGRVSIRFVIDRTGSVNLAQDAGSELADAGVVACVARAVADLTFPPPPDGIVTVTYPLVFSPGN